MRRLSTVGLVVLVALVLVTTAVAATTFYAGPDKRWLPNEGAGSAFSSGWQGNHFTTYGSGYDKSVTFIDNVRYAWHNTIRNRSGSTETLSPNGLTVKGHCKAYDGYFWGSCWLHH